MPSAVSENGRGVHPRITPQNAAMLKVISAATHYLHERNPERLIPNMGLAAWGALLKPYRISTFDIPVRSIVPR